MGQALNLVIKALRFHWLLSYACEVWVALLAPVSGFAQPCSKGICRVNLMYAVCLLCQLIHTFREKKECDIMLFAVMRTVIYRNHIKPNGVNIVIIFLTL